MSSAKRGRKGTGPRKRSKKEKRQTRFSFWNPGYFDARPDESHDEDDDAPVPLRPFISNDPHLGRYQLNRAETDMWNASLASAGEGPMTAEESAILFKMQLARLGRLPPDDPDAGEIRRHLRDSERVAARASWPARDDTVAARVRKRHRRS